MDTISSSFRPALVMTVLFALLLGIAYPLALTGAGQLLFPRQANGSLLTNARGQVIGSELIAQDFARADYFHPRPSAAGKGYDALASAGSNLGPASQALHDRVATDVRTLTASAPTASAPGHPVPADLVTASASGLDPDISPEAALYQVPRVAAARGLDTARVRALGEAQVAKPTLGFLGDPHVNVLLLNRQLDRLAATPAR
jgi:potassium-transporting ATPase KdpC subunit